jgi:hypothetical protein
VVSTTRQRTARPVLERAAAAAGVGSVVLTFWAFSVGDMGGRGLDPTMSTDALVRGLQAHAGDLTTAASLFMGAAVLMTVFVGSLWTRLGRAATWVAVIGASGGILAAVQSLDFAFDGMALASAADLGNGVAAQVLMTAGWDAARIAAAPFLVMVLAAVIAGFRFGVFPAWFRWLSLAFLVPLVAALAPVGPAGIMGLLGVLWVLVASLLFASERPAAHPPEDAVTA